MKDRVKIFMHEEGGYFDATKKGHTCVADLANAWLEENADKIEVIKIEHQQCFNEIGHWPIVSIMIHYRDLEK